MLTSGPDIIIFRGSPGSGKSETSKSLSKFFLKGARIEVDSIRQMVISVDWINQEEHINMLHVSTKIVFEFLNLGYRPVIVVDTFSGDKVNSFLTAFHKLDINLSIKVFGLFTSDDELKKRLEFRSDDKFKNFGICKKLNEDVQKIKIKNEFQINTTGLVSMQTAEIIYNHLNQKL